MVQYKFEDSPKSVMSALVVMLLVSTFSFSHTMGNPVDVNDDYYDIYNSGLVMNESDTLEYNDTLLESLFDSPYFGSRSDRNWRYSFSEDMDIDNDGMLSDAEKRQKIKTGMELVFGILDKNNDTFVSKEEISSPSLDLNAATDLATFYFDIAPDRYHWTYYDLMQMRYVDDNNDAFLSTQEIENALGVSTDDQKEIIRELFAFFDENNDNKLSMDDLKPKLNTLLTLMFKIYDQNNDGLLSLEDMDFKIQWDDITSILSTIKQKYMPNGEIDLNHFLLPFELDLNGDGAMNNLDLYLSWNNWRDYSTFGPLAKILKLLDQNQDGIYKFEDIKNFVVTIWSLLDANHDMSLSLEDGYLLLKDKLNVDGEKISALESYINYVKTFWKDEGTRLAGFIFHAIDRNGDEEITMQEFTEMPEMCFYGWREDSCFNPRRFPEAPNVLEGDEFFPQSKYFRIPSYRLWQSRLGSFALSILDSPMFYNVKEFDWAGAAEIENEIESLAPRGEALVNELRHKISAYKQVMSYLNDKEQ
jgi:Ca2+-binding EF-hand superfamily protein